MYLTEQEQNVFDIYFASISSMQFHPGSGKKDHKQLSLQECADKALEMIAIRREILGSKKSCHGAH